MFLRRKGRCGVFAGNSVRSTSERVVVDVLTIGAIQVQFSLHSFFATTYTPKRIFAKKMQEDVVPANDVPFGGPNDDNLYLDS